MPLYAGPAKLFTGAIALRPQGENGELKIGVEQETMEIANAMNGFIDAQSGDVKIHIDFTPFDDWGALAYWFPTAFKTPAIGTQYGALGADVLSKIWTPDGRLYSITSTFPIKPPELHLGNGIPLYGPAQIMGLVGTGLSTGTAGAFYTLSTGAADPGGLMSMAAFVRGVWTGAWGAVAGFGGDGGGALQAEEEFIITPEIKFQAYKVQKLTIAYKLISVKYMCKCRPYGPTQAQIDAALAIQAAPGGLGARQGLNGFALTLTGPLGKTITLNNAFLVSAGYEFGGSKLGNGEIGFVCGLTFTAGAPQPLIAFSA